MAEFSSEGGWGCSYLCHDSFLQGNILSFLGVQGQDLVINLLIKGHSLSVVKHTQQMGL